MSEEIESSSPRNYLRYNYLTCYRILSNRNKGRQNDYRSSISESSLNSSPVGSRPSTKSYSSGANANSNSSSNSGLASSGGGGGSVGGSVGGGGTNLKLHSDQSRNGPSSGSTSLTASDSSHLTSKSSPDPATAPASNTSSSQRVAVTPNSQDCSQQYTQSKDTALPPR